MNRIIHILLTVTAVLLLAACQGIPEHKAIERQLGLYPESRVQDIYKNFCQDNLGPGHMISNGEAAKAYLLSELESYKNDLDSGLYEKPSIRYIPVGDQGNYVRVDLSVVLDGLVGADSLLSAFVRSANDSNTLSPDRWIEKWAVVSEIIRKDFPNIPNASKDLATIDSLVNEGNLIMHHSRVYQETYHPHYRIIEKEIFEEEFKYKL